jgi:hypothetical protein
MPIKRFLPFYETPLRCEKTRFFDISILATLLLINLICLQTMAGPKFIGIAAGNLGSGNMGNGTSFAVDRSMLNISADLFLGVGFGASKIYFGIDAAFESRSQSVDIKTTGNTDLTGQGTALAPGLLFISASGFQAMAGYRMAVDHSLSKNNFIGGAVKYSGQGYLLRTGIQPWKTRQLTLGAAYTSDTFTQSLTPNVRASNISLFISYPLFGGGKK